MDTTRRLFLAAGSAGAVFGALSVAARAVPAADPVLAALAQHGRASTEMDAAYARSRAVLDMGDAAALKAAEKAEDEPFEALCAAEFAVLKAEPTTREGALRLLAYVADRLESDALGDRELQLAPDAIRAAVDLLAAEPAA